MAENAPPANKKDAMYEAMETLLSDSQKVKSAHFIAKQRKSKNSKIIGILVVVLNLFITSGLIEAATANQAWITIIIKLVSFVAAALAGIQTIFNFQKEIECHTNAGDIYSNIYQRLKLIMAEYQEKPTNRDALYNDFKALHAEHLKANADSKLCVPTDSDYNKARAGIKARGHKEKLKPAPIGDKGLVGDKGPTGDKG